MNVVYYPAGDANFASSRMRVFRIIPELRRLGHEAEIDFDPYGADVVVVQKRPDLDDLMKKCHKMGIRVIYDLDDWIPPLIPTACLADAITVDTNYKLKLFPLVDIPVDVIPDALDTDSDSPKKSGHAEILRQVVWTGNADNLYHLRSVAEACSALNIILTVITDLGDKFIKTLRDFPTPVKNCLQVVRWHQGSVDWELVKADLFVAPLMFDGPWDANWVMSKSANRIQKAWGLGLPVAATPIQSYTEAGLQYKAQTVDEWIAVLDRMCDPQLRIQDAQAGYERVQQFTADKIAQQWLKVFQGEYR